MLSMVNGNSIQYIIELDKKARERSAEAKNEADKILAQAKEKQEQIFKSCRSDSERRLEEFKNSCRTETNRRIDEIEAQKQKKLEAFDKRLDENRESLADEIFEAATGTKRRH